MTAKTATIPQPASPSAIVPTPAPGLRGQGSKNGGMAPRQTFAPANVAPPPIPMAGALEQKSVAPQMKMGSAKGNEVDMTTMGVRPTRLQDMLKTAMAQSAEKVNVSLEAARQSDVPAPMAVKQASGSSVDHEYALKLASAIEYIAEDFQKEAAAAENKQGIGRGPNHSDVSEAKGGPSMSDDSGQGKHVVPMNPGTEPGAGEKLETTMNNPAGFHSTQTTAMSGGKGKTAGEMCPKCKKEPCECKEEKKASVASLAKSLFKKASADSEKKESEGMAEVEKGLAKAEAAHEKENEKKAGIAALADRMKKVAEDAINPAHISAGPAVEPDTSAAGESGGNPVGGAPQGPSSLVGSNESAMNYKRNQAYAPRKGELKEYFSEPALTGATDKTLAAAFEHTSQAGTKFASAGVGTGTKVAAARAVLSKLAEEANNKGTSGH